jgi:hypothetical protein
MGWLTTTKKSAMEPLHYTIPNESGYFPAGSEDPSALLISVDHVTLFQIIPNDTVGKEGGVNADNNDDGPLASGTLTLRDPDAGTADDVVLVGQCGDVLFYIMADDATKKVSKFEFVLLLPKDCIIIDMTECGQENVLRVEALLAARTKFYDATLEGVVEPTNLSTSSGGIIYPAELPNDNVSKSMFWAASQVSQMVVVAGKLGASKIDTYGEKRKGEIKDEEKTNVQVGDAAIGAAKATRRGSEMVLNVTKSVTGAMSDILGGGIGRAAAIKDDDSALKKKARALLLASTISYGEISNGASECYELVVKSAKSQTTAFVAEKYGASAAELCRHTTGAVANFGSAALTARRVVNPKKIVKSAAKAMIKETIKGSIK